MKIGLDKKWPGLIFDSIGDLQKQVKEDLEGVISSDEITSLRTKICIVSQTVKGRVAYLLGFEEIKWALLSVRDDMCFDFFSNIDKTKSDQNRDENFLKAYRVVTKRLDIVQSYDEDEETKGGESICELQTTVNVKEEVIDVGIEGGENNDANNTEFLAGEVSAQSDDKEETAGGEYNYELQTNAKVKEEVIDFGIEGGENNDISNAESLASEASFATREEESYESPAKISDEKKTPPSSAAKKRKSIGRKGTKNPNKKPSLALVTPRDRVTPRSKGSYHLSDKEVAKKSLLLMSHIQLLPTRRH